MLSKDAGMHPECFMFCSFLDHFLGLHAPVNSFTRMITIIEHEEHTRRMADESRKVNMAVINSRSKFSFSIKFGFY